MALALGFAAASSLLPHNFTRFPKISTSSSSRGRCRVRHVSTVICFASDPQQLKQARQDLNDLIKTTRCNPLLIRLGWHDCGTYDKNIQEWPKRGGANGSLHFEIELSHKANAGLVNALKLLRPIKDKYPNITYADLFQLASATAIEEAGGPVIPMKYGRLDAPKPEDCPPEGKLPGAAYIFGAAIVAHLEEFWDSASIC